jgi:hypothetical protein
MPGARTPTSSPTAGDRVRMSGDAGLSIWYSAGVESRRPPSTAVSAFGILGLIGRRRQK